jgi:ribonuclease VapC
MKVFDASALLALLQGEPGGEEVEQALLSGGLCAAVNWSEIAQKVRAHGRNWDLAGSLLKSYGLVIEPVLEADAERAAARWEAGRGLSVADRLCLAVADRVEAEAVLTADRAWGSGGVIQQIR